MEYFTSLIPETLSKAIGFTVLHSLWQICLVSLIYYIVVKLFVKDNSRAKYNLAIISLFSCLTISVISFIYFFIEYKTVSNASNPLFGQSVILQIPLSAVSFLLTSLSKKIYLLFPDCG